VTDLRARQPKAIHSALTVLEEVARVGAGVTAKEISENLGLARATAYRLLNLLVQDEYLVRMPDLKGFALGRKVAELVGRVAPSRPPQAAREIMMQLRENSRGGIHLVRYDAASLRVIDIDPDFPLSDEARIIRELDSSAMGLLLLAELVLTGQRPRTSFRPAEAALEEILETTNRLGFASVAGRDEGLGCLSVPIRDSQGVLVAGLCYSGPRTRIDSPAALVEVLTSSGRALAPLLA
jgi:DNA-binding IclR family transcriptional regulator